MKSKTQDSTTTQTISQLIILPTNQDQVQLVKNYLAQTYPQQASWTIQLINPEQESIKIEQIRDLIQAAAYAPYQTSATQATVKQIIVPLYFDLATIPAQNALLKLIEEPPSHLQLILTTSQPTAILDTIRSRCMTINLIQQSNSTESSNTSTPLIILIEKLLTHPGQFTYGQLIMEAAQLTEKTDKATLSQELTNCLSWLTTNPALYAQPATLVATQCLLQAWQDVQANINLKLSMENCLFDIKKASK